MQTPTIFAESDVDACANVADDELGLIEVFYATDRSPCHPERQTYGSDRSETLTLGHASVRVGARMEPERLREEMNNARRGRKIDVSVEEIAEYGTTLHTLARSQAHHETIGGAPDELAATDEDTPLVEFLAEIGSRLRTTPRPDVYIYVHGFNNDFQEPLMTAAELHQYLDREGVMIAYLWPSRDHIFDYLSDRETALFTVDHFRLLVQALATVPGLGEIHIISHSTGARITGMALRELRLMEYDRLPDEVGGDLRLGHLGLLAPDVDLLIFKHRYFGEKSHRLPRHTTIYASKLDGALGLARKILYGLTRVGAASPKDLTEEDLEWLRRSDWVTVVDLEKRSTQGFMGHRHHADNPAVGSDLVLTLRCDLSPGERALVQPEGSPIWVFPPDYDAAVLPIVAECYEAPATAAGGAPASVID
jgi:esterase/lipase superfamily enzyme